jgi:hypothetical protein
MIGLSENGVHRIWHDMVAKNCENIFKRNCLYFVARYLTIVQISLETKTESNMTWLGIYVHIQTKEHI